MQLFVIDFDGHKPVLPHDLKGLRGAEPQLITDDDLHTVTRRRQQVALVSSPVAIFCLLQRLAHFMKAHGTTSTHAHLVRREAIDDAGELTEQVIDIASSLVAMGKTR